MTIEQFDRTAERQVLQHLIFDPTNAVLEIEKLHETFFHDSIHKEIFKTIRKVVSQGDTPDMYAVSEAIPNGSHAKAAKKLIFELKTEKGADYNFDNAAGTLEKYARNRVADNIIRSAIIKLNDFEDAASFLHESVNEQLITVGNSRKIHGIGDFADDTIDGLYKAMESNKTGALPPDAVPTGIDKPDLDYGGWIYESEYTILGARPGMGKSTLMREIALNAARAGHPTYIVSLDMTKKKVSRAMALKGIARLDMARKGHITEDQIQKAAIQAYELQSLPIHISGANDGNDILSISSNIMRWYYGLKTDKVPFVLWDYLQQVYAPGYRSRIDRTNKVSETVKMLSEKHGLAQLMLSQLSRALESRPDKRPIPSDLRESGQLEQDAQNIAFLYNDRFYNKDESEFNPYARELIFSKVREGTPQSYPLYADMGMQMMRSWDIQRDGAFDSGSPGVAFKNSNFADRSTGFY